MSPTTHPIRRDGPSENGSRTHSNGRPTRPAREVRRSLHEQLERAARVQRSLLPNFTGSNAGFRIASAYQPCEKLAGDFYDIVQSPERTTLMVADVMGHGAEAALITMLVKAVFHETAPSVGEANKILTRMNEQLLGLIPRGSFAATTVACLNPNSSDVQLSNAGLPYPYVLRASTRRVYKVRVPGVPLGMNVYDRRHQYDVFRVKLAPGDVLLISSDGIGSVERDDGRSFEDLLGPALVRLVGLAGDEVIQSLLDEALDFSNGRPFPDDINMVAVSRDQLGKGN